MQASQVTVSMDKVFLQGLETHCVIGVWEWEKRITQRVMVDLELAADVAAAAATDQLEDTLNYKAVAERVKSFAEASRFGLIETLAEKIAELVIDEFSTPWVRVTVNKGGVVKHCANVGIQIERGAAPDA